MEIPVNTSHENQPVKPEAKQPEPEAIKSIAKNGVVSGVANHLEAGLPKAAEMHHFLHLSIPHFTNAEQAEAKPGEKYVVLARGPGGRGNGGPQQRKRNGPLGMILNLLGIHGNPQRVAEFRIHVEVTEDGTLRQSVTLPAGWRAVQLPADGSVSIITSA
jgi:hypothetical protein